MLQVTKYFKHTTTGEIYKEGKDQNSRLNLINVQTGSEFYLPGEYGEHDFFPFEPTTYKNIDDKEIYLSGGDWKIGRLREIISKHEKMESDENPQ